MRNLPNLNAVRAFEAAARHGSFAGAAGELGVGHAAVSRHVRNLERELAVALFERHARHVELTGEGYLFSRTAAQALSSLELDTGRLKRTSPQGAVVLDVESDLASRWLLPCLTSETLDRLGVTLDIRVHPDPPTEFLRDVDLAITWGSFRYKGFNAELLITSKAFPVAAPRLIAKGPPPHDGAFYTSHRLIHQRGVYWWTRYFEQFDRNLNEAHGHLFFNRTRMCIDAAVQGLGLAIGDEAIVHDHLASGALVRLPGPFLANRENHYLFSPATDTLPQRVKRVRDWLFATAAETVVV